MIVYPNAKINLGLSVVEKRPDGYHNLETVFYPIGWCDILEVLPGDSPEPGVAFTASGLPIPGDPQDNLCVKAYHLIAKDYPMPSVKAHLHKIIPMGAGLGGGSSDAAFFIRALNDVFELNLAWGELHHYAKQLGADCSFFITNRPVFAEGRGDQLESISLSLAGYHVVVVYPGIHVSTPEAFAHVTPKRPEISLEDFVPAHPLEAWKDVVKNDFEASVFLKYPAIADVKQKLYDEGAIFAGMSGSGSAVFGIFSEEKMIAFDGMSSWRGKL